MIARRYAAWVICLSSLAATGQTFGQQTDAQTAAQAAYERAQAASRAKRYDEAERAYRESLEHDPGDAATLNDLAWMLLTAEDLSVRRPVEALALAERAVERVPKSGAYLDTLATAHDANGRHVEAARIELEAIGLDPTESFYVEQLQAFAARAHESLPSASSFGYRAWGALLGAGANEAKLALALADFETAITNDPMLLMARTGKARVLAALGKWKEAANCWGLALALGGEASETTIWTRYAQALEHVGRHAAACEAREVAIARTPKDLDLRRAIAEGWLKAGDPQRALQHLDAALAQVRLAPPLWPTRDLPALYLIGARAHEARGAKADALAERVRAVATRAQDRKLDARVLKLAREQGVAGDAAAVRATLAERVLGIRDAPRFEDVSAATLPDGKVAGRRVALADVDGDGDADILVGGSRLLLNDGTGRFAQAANSGLQGGTTGGVFADWDRDGDLDLYAIAHGKGADRLYRNVTADGVVRFRDETLAAGLGLTDDHPSEGAAWGDLNGDGYPDLYVANYELPGEPLARGTPDRLYLSDGQGGFRDASAEVSTEELLCGRGVSMADFDLDGDTDIFVSNYRLDRDLLWVNDGGKFQEQAERRGVAGERIRGSYGHTIGAVWGDLDLDGDMDLVAANLAHPRFKEFSDATFIYLQQPDGRFVDARAAAGVAFEETHSNPTLFDPDDDGDLDLYLTCVYGGRPSFLWRNRVTEDRPPGFLRAAPTFDDVTWVAGARVFNGWGAAVADLDGDGDQDLVVCGAGGVRILRNTGPGGRSVRIRLRGVRTDTWGAGATAALTDGIGRRLVRQVTLGHGTTSQSEPILQFGVGEAQGPFALEVRWPSGVVSQALVGRGLHVIEEPEE